MLDGELDVPVISMLEQKFEKSRFTRVDSDVIDRLIVKEEAKENALESNERDNLSAVFNASLPALEKAEFMVDVQPLGATTQPVVITQNEYMRRMKEMSRFQAGMNFYAQMPDSYNLVLNSDHPLIAKVLDDCKAKTANELHPIECELKGLQARIAALRQEQGKKKPEEITQEEKDDLQNTQKQVDEQQSKKKGILAEYAKGNDIVHQLIDLALLQNGMLKGAALNAFLKRSVDIIK